jgi:Transcriptional regulator, AbiEi antitoxin
MDAALFTAGARRNGLVCRTDLEHSGLSSKSITAVVERGWLRRVHRGVYAFAGAPRSWNQQMHAAALFAGTGAAVSHSCAATLWEFAALPYLTKELSVQRDRRIEIDGFTVHHVSSLPGEDITERAGMPVTTFERTLVDCSTVLSRFQLARNLDEGLRRNVASLARLSDTVSRLRSGPGRRLSVMHAVLDERAPGYNPGGSREERRVLDVLVEGGLPAPVQQYRIRSGGRTYYLDYAYPEHRVFIEYYGVAWHGTPSAVVYDSERVTALSVDGWQPLIFTGHTPDHVMIERTSLALGTARAPAA